MSRTKADENAIVKVEGIDPTFLAQLAKDDDSLSTMQEYRIVPRLKFIQATTEEDLKDQFGEGSVIVRPGNGLVCTKKDSFQFVPLFFFTEWTKMSDLKDNENPVVMERSYDPTHPVAIKAKDSEKRHELYDGHKNLPPEKQWHYRYVEHFRFIGKIHGEHELSDNLVVLSFERGEYGQGRNFISSVSMRKQRIEMPDGSQKSIQIPLYLQVWEFKTSMRAPDQSRKWYGFDFAPGTPSIVGAAEAVDNKAMYDELKADYDAKKLVVDEVKEDATEDTTNSEF